MVEARVLVEFRHLKVQMATLLHLYVPNYSCKQLEVGNRFNNTTNHLHTFKKPVLSNK